MEDSLADEAEDVESADIDGGWSEGQVGVNVSSVYTAAWPVWRRERGQSRCVSSGMGGVWVWVLVWMTASNAFHASRPHGHACRVDLEPTGVPVHLHATGVVSDDALGAVVTTASGDGGGDVCEHGVRQRRVWRRAAHKQSSVGETALPFCLPESRSHLQP